MVERISFDTNVFWHGLLPSDDPIAPICERLWAAIDDSEIEAWCSTLVIIELAKVIRPELSISRAVALTDTLRRSRINWVDVTPSIAFNARELALERVIASPYDAVILATAIEVGVPTLMTHDRADFPTGDEVDGVRVREPYLPVGLSQERLELDG